MYFLYDNVFLQFWNSLNSPINSEARSHRLFSFFFQWLVSLCKKMGLVYIRQVHVIGTILQMEVVQSDGKTKLCTVLCQFLDWPFKTNKIIIHNLPTMQCFYWLKHTLFLPSINIKKITVYVFSENIFFDRLKKIETKF